MNPSRHPARRTFLRLLGALTGIPAAARAAVPAAADERERWLRDWSSMPRIPVTRADDEVTRELFSHARHGRPLALYYHGGSDPGRLRRFSPELVFRHERGRHLYVSGHCHLRGAPRVLRIDRIGLA